MTHRRAHRLCRRAAPWGALTAAAAAVMACSGDAVIDESSSSGSGGASSSSSGTGGSTSTSTSTSTGSSSSASSSSSATGSSGSPYCEAACDAIEGCLDPNVNCEGRCGEPNYCQAELNVLLQCIASAVDGQTCALPNDCQPAFAAYADCRTFSSMEAMCEGDSQSCYCQMTSVDMFSFASWCQLAGSAAACTCTFNGEILGTCTFADGLVCDPLVNCCRTLIGVTAEP